MYDPGLHFKSEVNREDARHFTSAEKLLVEAYNDVFVILREIDDFIVSDSRRYLRCRPTEISKIFIQPEQLFVEENCGSMHFLRASFPKRSTSASLEAFPIDGSGNDRDCYFLKYLRHFLHWKRFSEIVLSGKLQKGHVSRIANVSSDPENASVLRPSDGRPIAL